MFPQVRKTGNGRQQLTDCQEQEQPWPHKDKKIESLRISKETWKTLRNNFQKQAENFQVKSVIFSQLFFLFTSHEICFCFVFQVFGPMTR